MEIIDAETGEFFALPEESLYLPDALSAQDDEYPIGTLDPLDDLSVLNDEGEG